MRAYRDFYTWRNIGRGAASKDSWTGRARHVAYAAGWKKFERVWDVAIQARRLSQSLPVLEATLSGLGRVKPRPLPPEPATAAGVGQPVRVLAARRFSSRM